LERWKIAVISIFENIFENFKFFYFLFQINLYLFDSNTF
jgi:hypothetical protein